MVHLQSAHYERCGIWMTYGRGARATMNAASTSPKQSPTSPGGTWYAHHQSVRALNLTLTGLQQNA